MVVVQEAMAVLAAEEQHPLSLEALAILQLRLHRKDQMAALVALVAVGSKVPVVVAVEVQLEQLR